MFSLCSHSRNSRRPLALSTLFLLAACSLHAQIDAGRIEGTVKDASGAAIPKATVAITNNETNVVQTVSTGSGGTYIFEAVKPGTYTVTAQSPGFQKFTALNAIAHVQQTLDIDIAMTAGAVATEVTVTTAAPLLQASDASLGQTITGQEVNDLPLAGRNWVSLAQLSAGVTTTAGGTTGSALFVTNGVNFWQNDIRLDGIDNNEEAYGGTQFGTNAAFTPPPDAIQEFKLQTGDFSAEFGHSTGSVLNAVIKSGSNMIHGDLWEYIRNTVFNASDYFAKQNPNYRRPAYHQNQFGGTVGGPVVLPHLYRGQDKTFFFFDYQGTRIVQPSPSTSYVPTLAQRNSGFTNFQDYIALAGGTASKMDALGRSFALGTFFDPATTRTVQPGATDPVSGFMNTGASAIVVRDPFYSGGSVAGIRNFTTLTQYLNQIPANRVDPNAVKLLSLYPSPTPGLPGRQNYSSFASASQTINQFDVRIDQNFSPKDIVFGVYDFSHTVYTTPPNLPGLAEGQNFGAGNTEAPRYAIALGYTHVFTPTLTNEAHAGWSHSIERIIPFEANTSGIPAQYGISGVPQSPGNGGLPVINVDGYTGLGVAAYVPTLETVTDLELLDNVTKVYGSHTFKAGGQLDVIRAGIIQPPYGKGSFTYTGQYSDIPNQNSGYNGAADFLVVPSQATVPNGISNLGGVSSYGSSNYAQTKTRRYYSGVFFQDDWKATSRLTLNLGLRWDHYTPYAEVNGRQANFIASNGGNGPTGTYYMSQKGCALPRSSTFNTLLSSSGITLNCNASDATGNAQSFNFAPRIGFAMRATDRLVIRGGYGIAYGALDNIGFGGTLGTNYPFSYTVSFNAVNSQTPLTTPTGATATIENALSGQDLQNPVNVPGNGVGLFGRQYDFQTPYTQTLNFTVQDQFTNHDSIQIAYVGTMGRHLDSLGAHNSPSAILPPGTSIYDPTIPGHIPFPDFSPNSQYQITNGSSSYNSMQATYQHELSVGLTLLANYTFAKCLTNQRTISGNNPGYRAQWLPGFGINGDYGLCDSDTKHVTHVSGSYALPFGREEAYLHNIGRLTDLAVGGWKTNFIVSHQSGQPFTIGCPQQTTSDFGCFALTNPTVSLYAAHRSPQQWLNPAAFRQPSVATAIGQTDFSPLGGSPNQVRGPGFSNVDLSLFKEFAIWETLKLQFRAEAFNVFNNHSFGQPGNLNFQGSNFSQITYERNNARLGQFALKLFY